MLPKDMLVVRAVVTVLTVVILNSDVVLSAEVELSAAVVLGDGAKHIQSWNGETFGFLFTE